MRPLKDRPRRPPFCLKLLNTYECKYCAFETDLKVCLHQHLRTDHQNEKVSLQQILRNYKCKNCNFSTYSALVLISHRESSNHVISLREKVRIFAPRKTFKCTQCLYYTQAKSSLVRHIKKEHKNVVLIFKCVLAEATFEPPTDNTNLSKKVEFNCSILPEAYRCQHCDFTNCLKIVVMNHTSVYHKGRSVESLTKPLLGRYKCECCDFSTYSALVLLNHKMFKCKNCWFSVMKQAKAVKKSPPKSKISKRDDSQSKPFKCDRCGFQMRYRGSFKKHMLDCHKVAIGDLRCELCSYQYKQEHQLKSHFLSKHTSIDDAPERFECKHCSYVSKHKRSLKGHVLRRHSDVEGIVVKWFQCELCPYKNIVKSAVTKHVKSRHSGKKKRKRKKKK